MGLTVQKYGGTSLQTPERIRAVAKRIARVRSRSSSLVIVVSAMGHTTDELIGLAHEVAVEPPHREMDMLLTAGERISMALLSMALADLKVPAVSLTGSQTGIVTTSSHRRARIQQILGDRVRQALGDDQVAIVAGFQGISETREVTTLGRGGSDTTAVALAAALKADLCEIYTDVDGIFSADPRVVSGTRLWREIPHDLMVEMASRGAGILHPRCVELAKEYQVPLRVRNSLNEDDGTVVISMQSIKRMEEFSIAAVTMDRGKFWISVELERAEALSVLWAAARKAGLPLVSPVFLGEEVFFFADRDAEGEWRRVLEGLSSQQLVRGFRFDSELVPLSVIGTRISQDASVLHEATDVLRASQIPVVFGSVSALAMTLAVPAKRAEEGIRVLHQELIEKRRDSR